MLNYYIDRSDSLGSLLRGVADFLYILLVSFAWRDSGAEVTIPFFEFNLSTVLFTRIAVSAGIATRDIVVERIYLLLRAFIGFFILHLYALYILAKGICSFICALPFVGPILNFFGRNLYELVIFIFLWIWFLSIGWVIWVFKKWYVYLDGYVQRNGAALPT